MERVYFNWETTHDRVRDVMTHSFVGDIACVVSFMRATLTITHKGRTVDVMPLPNGYTVRDHFNDIIHRIAAIAHRLFFRRHRLKTLCNVLRSV